MDSFTETGILKVGEPLYRIEKTGAIGLYLPPVYLGDIISVDNEIITVEFKGENHTYKIIKDNKTYAYIGKVVYDLQLIS